MKTVKHKANVGERILITTASLAGEYYKEGDVLTVEKREGNGVYAEGIPRWVHDIEYEVIIEEAVGIAKGIIEQMQAELARTKDELAELKSKVAALEGKRGVDIQDIHGHIGIPRKINFMKSPQQIRDEIMAKANADVADVAE